MRQLLPVLAAGLIIFSSCAHGPVRKGGLDLRGKVSPDSLLQQACSPGSGIREVKGVAWMKAKSREASGQFPANIQAVAPDSLKLEVTQAFGSTFAVLTVHGSNYKIDVPGHPERNKEGADNWGGIPLNWATDLFLGKIPCPSATALARSSLSITDEDELLVEVKNPEQKTQKFVYGFVENHGRYWANALHWESGSAAVDFSFADPDGQTQSPQKWEARSSKGEVKIRWREREMVR